MHAVATKPKALVPAAVPLSASQAHSPLAPKHHHIWLVTGPAGCGKTTIAQYIAKSLNMPYIEGDEFHPPANIDKMSNNIPLTDSDRWDWLTALRQESLRRLSTGSSGVVLTCSALKRKYRDVIRVAPYYDRDLLVHFIYLDAPEEVIIERVSARTNHYMGSSMVQSQFDILEPPATDESDAIVVDSTKPLDQVKDDALAKVINVINNDA